MTRIRNFGLLSKKLNSNHKHENMETRELNHFHSLRTYALFFKIPMRDWVFPL